MNDYRPDPDSLLISASEESSVRGKLRIYFGCAAGVGKSYAMLKGAHELKRQGIDVVVAYLEAHGRVETESLLLGLPQIPPLIVNIAGGAFRELDLEAVLKRRPQVVLIDEMAHTNADGCRHPKRWMDIEDILAMGSSVHTTVNVQHLASLNDIIAQITGVAVRETIPDSLFDKADEVTLVDITPDELLKRFKSGKVYRSAQAETAMANFFKKGNLVALREIALRRTAERVHADVDRVRLSSNVQTVIPTQERFACLIDGDEASASALRTTARLAGAAQCPWSALDVESARQIARLPAEEKRYQAQIRLAEDLGGRVVHLSGAFRAGEVLRWARRENITKLVIARPSGLQPGKWIERLTLFFMAENLDILWARDSGPKAVAEKPEPSRGKKFNLRPYLETTGIVLFTFMVAALLGFLKAPEANLTVIYLLGVILAAVIHGEGASAWAAFLSAFILGFGLTNFTWRVSWENSQYLIDFGISLIIGLLASQMTSRLKNQAEIARRERQRTEALYHFTMTLAGSAGLHQIAATAETVLQKFFARQVIILLPNLKNEFRPLLQGSTPLDQDATMGGIADYVAQSGRSAGPGTQTLPNAKALYLPLKCASETVGVLVIAREKSDPINLDSLPDLIADIPYYERFTQPLAAKIEGALVLENTERVYWQAERERLRGDLLGSVSQGLKTPLSIITATSESLMLGKDSGQTASERAEMILLLHDESVRLRRLIDNLTNLMRFENGKLPIHAEKIELNEFVQAEVVKLQRSRTSHKMVFRFWEKSIETRLDPLLFAQVIFNIIDNATLYSPKGSVITVSTTLKDQAPRLVIEDEGDGIPEGELEKIFEKYYRLSSRSRGAGLGLTVCRAIVEAHGARLWAENRSPKGLRLIIEMKEN